MIFNWLKGEGPASKKTKRAEEGETPPGLSRHPDGQVENAVALAAGLEMKEAFYPGHAPIDAYGNGGFRFGSLSHQGALLFLPSGIHRWDVVDPGALALADFGKVRKEAGDIELLLIGTGEAFGLLDQTISDALKAEGIKIDIMDTGAAVRTLNILLSDGRAVAAALLPVE